MVILSYSCTADLIQVLPLESEYPILAKAARLAVSNATALHFSYLVQLDRCSNKITSRSRSEQEKCIQRLLSGIKSSDSNNDDDSDDDNDEKLQRLEFSGLRHIIGDQGNWLKRIFGSNNYRNPLFGSLTSVDFSGCAMLDPRAVHAALVLGSDRSNYDRCDLTPDIPYDDDNDGASSNIIYLNFQGCCRIDDKIVTEITRSPRFRRLQSLGLGGCSQTIGDECVQDILAHLRELRFLDLSGLKHITERSADDFPLFLAPDALESLELAGCELIRFSSLQRWSRIHLPRRRGYETNNHNRNSPPFSTIVDPAQCTSNYWETGQIQWVDDHDPLQSRKPMKKLSRLNFNGIGTPRRGLVAGALPYFALRSMGALQEVYLSGCEQVQDWEIEILARVCANSLSVLEMRSCCIGDDAVRAVGRYCTNVSDIDFSACFQITDEGMVSLCQNQGIYYEDSTSTSGSAAGVKTRRRRTTTPSIRSLKIAALLQITDESILAIGALESLLFLDVSNCPKVTEDSLRKTVKELTSLVEVDAKGIGKWGSAAATLYSYDDEPRYLRFVNGRPFHKAARNVRSEDACRQLCTVREHSKHVGQGVPLQPMYHCEDCRLIPSLNRGMCHGCSVHCHKKQGHNVFVGSFTRFYCDCPFDISKLHCQALSHYLIQTPSLVGADSTVVRSV